ncbi:MAG: ABC transporter permease, partial [Acidobacteriia bacterium]|nr:ABC transporter permease [Terriglobia bacterium]MBV8906604.1 ABC transporter permease [Terriglobia bacterium]
MDTLLHDLRYAGRMLRLHRGFTLITTITLALGIGVNVGVFSIVHALLIRPLPYRDAARLVYVSEFWPHEPAVPSPVSPDFENWRREGRLFDAMEAYGSGASMNLAANGFEPERVSGVMVTSGFLDQLGIRLALGRNFTREEDTLGGPAAVILSDSLWRRRFGASGDILGKPVNLDGRAYTVVGVLPAAFVFPDNNFRSDLLIPMALPPNPNWHDERNFRILRVLARLKPGVTLALLRAELAGIVRNHASEEPPQFVTMRKDLQITVAPLRDRLSGDIRPVLVVLEGAVLMVLLIGCLNVANLQIARAIPRQREFGIRAALGAGGG